MSSTKRCCGNCNDYNTIASIECCLNKWFQRVIKLREGHLNYVIHLEGH